MMMYCKNDERDKAIKKLTRRGTDKYLQESYDMASGEKDSKEVSIHAAFNIADYVHYAGKQCFINMNLLRTFENSHIDGAHRTPTYYHPYKEKMKEVVVLEIPKGFRVAHLPAAAKGSVDGLWSYSVKYKSDGKTIKLIKEYELNTMEVKHTQFAANNKMVDDLKKIYKESVVLTAK
jgi:hypothetical protein